jgi:hypothetical protein
MLHVQMSTAPSSVPARGVIPVMDSSAPTMMSALQDCTIAIPMLIAQMQRAHSLALATWVMLAQGRTVMM